MKKIKRYIIGKFKMIVSFFFFKNSFFFLDKEEKVFYVSSYSISDVKISKLHLIFQKKFQKRKHCKICFLF